MLAAGVNSVVTDGVVTSATGGILLAGVIGASAAPVAAVTVGSLS